jgi:hypothetical protein
MYPSQVLLERNMKYDAALLVCIVMGEHRL